MSTVYGSSPARIAILSTCLISSSALSGPTGGSVVSGTGNITLDNTGTITTIQQNTNQLAIDWQSFNVQSGEQVVFNQPGATSIALNRDFSGVPSEIFGNISANGQVYLLNTAGVLMGSGSNVSVAGLMVSDLSLSNSEFDNFETSRSMSLQDADPSAGGLVLNGNITTSTRNGVTLAGQYIDNSGTILANNGNINLAIADGPIVITDSAGTLGVQISQGITQNISSNGALFNNSGDITASQGNIDINIQYLSNLNVLAVNNTGNINAVGIGYGNINQNIVLQAPPQVPPSEDLFDDTLSDYLATNNDNTENSLPSDGPRKPASSLNDLIDDCSANDTQDRDCLKKKAIKHYLGRLLIGGSLPD